MTEQEWAMIALGEIRNLAPFELAQLPDDNPYRAGYVLGLLMSSAIVGQWALEGKSSRTMCLASLRMTAMGLQKNPGMGVKTGEGMAAAVADALSAMEEIR